MTSPFVAEIRIFTADFAPKGWALCDGQILPLSQNTALFSLLGTTYGGNGVSTFALPDMQGNVPVSFGQSTTGTVYDLGEASGTDTVTLLQSEMPLHTHTAKANIQAGTNQTGAANLALSRSGGGAAYFASPTQAQTQAMHPLELTVAGGSLPHNNLQPYLVLNFIIALQGVFPPRS
jgi:microcystin-dependent protein